MVRAATILRGGGVIVIPTDTVYGLAANVFCPDAVRRVFAIKGRPADAPVPVLIPTAADLTLLASRVPRQAWDVISRFWPGPLTLVLPAKPSVDPFISGGRDRVALRVPASRSCLELLSSCGVPLTGTSANRSGMPAAVSAEEAVGQIGEQVDAILRDETSPPEGLPSTVIELGRHEYRILRQGALSAAQVAAVLGPEFARTR
jgi:L-threonylcarbamoyladenylate synthase